MRPAGLRAAFNLEASVPEIAGQGQMIDAAGRDDTGNGGHPGEQFAVKGLAAMLRFDFGAGNRHDHRKDIVLVEAGRNALQGKETANGQPGADQENKGQGKFGRDQEAAQVQTLGSVAAAAAAFLQRTGKIAPGRMKGRDEAKDYRGDRGDGE